MAYCALADVRLLTNLTTSDISDADVNSLIAYATAQLNKDVQVRINREEIEYIDTTRRNRIDGSNTTFYVERWEKYYIGDSDNDGTISTVDVAVYQIATDGTETQVNLSSIDQDYGQFVVAAAPSAGVRLEITYYSAPVDMSTPHQLIKQACVYLTAAMCNAKINFGKATSFRAGNTSITRDMDAYNRFYELYQKTIESLRDMIDIKDATSTI